MSWVKAFTAVVLGLGAILTGAALTPGDVVATPGPISGIELAERLGLERIAYGPNDCRFVAEVEAEDHLYCLDSQVSDPVEAQLLVLKLRGIEPTAEHRRMFELGEELDRISERDPDDSDPEYLRVAHEYMALRQRLET